MQSPKSGAPLKTTAVAEDERFEAMSPSAALIACERRILELDGQILRQTSSDEDDDE